MIEEGFGRIINIASVYGSRSPIHAIYEYKNNEKKWYKPYAYGASKAALINTSKYLATIYAENNITINCISPSGIENNQDKEFKMNYYKYIPIKRLARKEEIGPSIEFLLKKESSFITGTNINIDGGWTSW